MADCIECEKDPDVVTVQNLKKHQTRVLRLDIQACKYSKKAIFYRKKFRECKREKRLLLEKWIGDHKE